MLLFIIIRKENNSNRTQFGSCVLYVNTFVSSYKKSDTSTRKVNVKDLFSELAFVCTSLAVICLKSPSLSSFSSVPVMMFRRNSRSLCRLQKLFTSQIQKHWNSRFTIFFFFSYGVKIFNFLYTCILKLRLYFFVRGSRL